MSDRPAVDGQRKRGVTSPWELLHAARKLAWAAHRGQVDKAGQDYVGAHVADVARRVARFGPRPEVVAWLHDVVEDTDVELDDIHRGFGEEITYDVDAITHREHEPRTAYYARIRTRPWAHLVKLVGDIPSNSDPTRLFRLDPDVGSRLMLKYHEARELLSTFELAGVTFEIDPELDDYGTAFEGGRPPRCGAGMLAYWASGLLRIERRGIGDVVVRLPAVLDALGMQL